MYIIKQISDKQSSPPMSSLPDFFELFATESLQDINGDDVTIPKSLGRFSVETLEKERATLVAQIAEIDIKLDAINTHKLNIKPIELKRDDF